MHVAQGLLMLALLFVAFWAMTRHDVPQALAMPLLACASLALAPSRASALIAAGFHEFAYVSFLFTAVAVPAHIIQRSGAFQWLGAWLGQRVGVINLLRPGSAVPILTFVLLVVTYVTAALFHNITSILVMVHITIGLCSTYNIPSRWLLSGELVASNLGGFSTAWGDTPNIIESAVWSLTHADFAREILPPNLLVLFLLTVVVARLTLRSYRVNDEDPNHDAWEAAGYKVAIRNLSVDRRSLALGLLTLGFFIAAQYLRKDLEMGAAALAIGGAVLLDRRDDRLRALQALDLDLYSVLASIFVLARAVEASWLGECLRAMVLSTGAAPWSIAASAYLGTAFTEAASWASAVARPIYEASASHAAAWALGGGICAGSSSLVTAASAGIILSAESRRYPGHEVTFGKYLAFGLPASLLMLTFYAAYFTAWR
jgi:Na+/H+ antiporter NhaD/arsenite permease-like protein